MQVAVPVLARSQVFAQMAVADRPPAQLRRAHRHLHGEWNLMLAGQARYLIDGQPYECLPGDVLWLPAGCTHWLVRAPGAVLLVVHTTIGVDAPPHLRWCDPATALELTWLARRHPGDAHLAEVVARRLSHIVSERPTVPPTVALALARLHINPAGCTLSMAAQTAGVTAGHLSGLMRRHTGHTFTWQRGILRLLLAGAHWTPDGGWTAAAASAGFGCFMQFHRVFLTIAGAAPRRWMQRVSASAGSPPSQSPSRSPAA